MAQIPNQQLRRVGLLIWLVVSGFLVAHSINAFVADALYFVPERPNGLGESDSALPVSYSPTQYAEDVRSGGLFRVRPASLGMMNQDGATRSPVRGSLGVAAKIRLIGVVLGEQRGVFAIVEELSSKKQVLYRLHDQIPDLGEVSEIRRDGMIVRQGDQEELLKLRLSDKPTVAAVGSGPAASQAPGAPVRPARASTSLPRGLPGSRRR